MKILKRGFTPSGTAIQIEDWSEDYPSMPYGRTLASYPKSKTSHEGPYAPKGNQVYRFEFDFASNDDAEGAFDSLVSGARVLADYKDHLYRKEYADCI